MTEIEIATKIIPEILKLVINEIGKHISKKKQNEQKIRFNFGDHLNQLAKWSSRIEFFGLSQAKKTDESTISLKIDTVPRLFKGKKDNTKKIDETGLLKDRENYLLLGDPGAGKTTTIKRLARLLLFQEPIFEEDSWQYPIVIRLREKGDNFSIPNVMADVIGINYEIKEIKKTREIIIEEEQWDPIEKIKRKVTKKKTESYSIFLPFIGSDPLERVLSRVLNGTNAVIFFDGLDEVPYAIRDKIKREIFLFADSVPDCKVVVSCRTGEFKDDFEGFDTLQICPLDPEQVFSIVSKWIDTPDSFIKKLKKLPYQDLIDRPLFLTHLIVIYHTRGYLPDQPSEVYRQTVDLLLEKWDRKWGIRRESKYSGFSIEKKFQFLSALSYYLTYKYKLTNFKTEDLMHIYQDICRAFNLPKIEAESVAKELETHTGIINESSDNSFEFSHLSLQEYLCADYLVRDSYGEHFLDYLKERPAPIAIAVALSSNPSNFFSDIILSETYYQTLNTDNLYSLFSRILQEKPYFVVSSKLGLAIIRLMRRFDFKKYKFFIDEVFRQESVVESFSRALTWYSVDLEKSSKKTTWIKREKYYAGEHKFYSPEEGPIPSEYIAISLKSSNVIYEERVGSSGNKYGVFVNKSPD